MPKAQSVPCPLCPPDSAVRLFTPRGLARHVWRQHLSSAEHVVKICWCGGLYTWDLPGPSLFVSHLAQNGGVAAHYLACYLGNQDP